MKLTLTHARQLGQQRASLVRVEPEPQLRAQKSRAFGGFFELRVALEVVVGAARAREIAVRAALGAPRSRLVGQLLTESAVLAVVGAASGIFLSIWSLDLLLAAAPETIRHLSDVRLDRSVLAFAAAVTALTTILFGLVPALQSTRSHLVDALKDGGTASAGPSRGRLRRALVVGQFALSLMLLLGAGLLLRSFAEILRVRPGFDASSVLATEVTLGGAAYEKRETQQRYWTDAVRRVASVPGVDAAGAIAAAPLEGIGDWSYVIERREPRAGEPGPDDQLRQVTPGYFRAMRIPIHQGRDFTEGDDTKAPLVLLVNEAWVRRFFPGHSSTTPSSTAATASSEAPTSSRRSTFRA